MSSRPDGKDARDGDIRSVAERERVTIAGHHNRPTRTQLHRRKRELDRTGHTHASERDGYGAAREEFQKLEILGLHPWQPRPFGLGRVWRMIVHLCNAQSIPQRIPVRTGHGDLVAADDVTALGRRGDQAQRNDWGLDFAQGRREPLAR